MQSSNSGDQILLFYNQVLGSGILFKCCKRRCMHNIAMACAKPYVFIQVVCITDAFVNASAVGKTRPAVSPYSATLIHYWALAEVAYLCAKAVARCRRQVWKGALRLTGCTQPIVLEVSTGWIHQVWLVLEIKEQTWLDIIYVYIYIYIHV